MLKLSKSITKKWALKQKCILRTSRCFGKHNRPTESAFGNTVRKFKQTESVAEVKTTLRACVRRLAGNIAAVRENVAENLDTFIRYHTQEFEPLHKTLHRTTDLVCPFTWY